MGSQALSFNDVKSQVNQLVNDVTGMGNQVASQIKDVQGALTDLAQKSQQGQPVSQADYQSVIAQLGSVHSLVQQATSSVAATHAQIQSADPGYAESAPDPSSTPGSTGSTGTDAAPTQSGPASTISPTSTATQTGVGSTTDTSTSSTPE